MNWMDVLKLKVWLKSEQAAVDLFALIVKNRLEGKDWDASPTGQWHEGDLRAKGSFDYLLTERPAITNFDPHNPQEIINEAKKLKYWINRTRFDGLDLNKHLQYFITVMKTYGYNMEEFKKVKGLLPQEATSGGGDVDLTPKIKQVIQMFKHMNKPITQESVMEELDLDEKNWKDEYDKLLRN